MQTPSSRAIPWRLALAVVLVGLLIVAGVLGWLAWQFTLLDPTVAGVLRVAAFVLLYGIPTAGVAVGLLTAYNRWGRYPVVLENKKIELQRAAIQIAPQATSFTYHDSHQQLPPPVIDVPALAEPPGHAVDVGPLTRDAWLQLLDTQPHAIFAAKTKGGKSTMARVGLTARIERGESIFIIDPHANGWLDLPGVGGGLNWPVVEDALSVVARLYQDRQAERARYLKETGRELPHDHFLRLTIIIDEANETRAEIERRHGTKKSPWQGFVEVMGSGARKVGISLWLICQSALVKDLGGSTVMRRNFTVFALDHATIRELVEAEEPVKARREAILDRVGGSSYPAATAIEGQAFLLDRTGLDQLEPDSARGCAWDSWDYTRDGARQAVAPTQQLAPPAEQTVITVPPASLPTTIGDVRLSWVIAHMLKRELPHEEIAKLAASLVLRARPGLDRQEVQNEVARRAASFAANDAIEALAARLDREALLRACLQVGADVALALAIYGGKRQAFYDLARVIKSAGNIGNTESDTPVLRRF